MNSSKSNKFKNPLAQFIFISAVWFLSNLSPASAVVINIDFQGPGETDQIDASGLRTTTINFASWTGIDEFFDIPTNTSELGDSLISTFSTASEFVAQLEDGVVSKLEVIFKPITDLFQQLSFQNFNDDEDPSQTGDNVPWVFQVGDRLGDINEVNSSAGFSTTGILLAENVTSALFGSAFTNVLLGSGAPQEVQTLLRADANVSFDKWNTSVINAIAGTAAHEIGHALGLGHNSFDTTALGVAGLDITEIKHVYQSVNDDCRSIAVTEASSNPLASEGPTTTLWPESTDGASVDLMLDHVHFDDRCRLRPREFITTDITLLAAALPSAGPDAQVIPNVSEPFPFITSPPNSPVLFVPSPPSIILLVAALLALPRKRTQLEK